MLKLYCHHVFFFVFQDCLFMTPSFYAFLCYPDTFLHHSVLPEGRQNKNRSSHPLILKSHDENSADYFTIYIEVGATT